MVWGTFSISISYAQEQEDTAILSLLTKHASEEEDIAEYKLRALILHKIVASKMIAWKDIETVALCIYGYDAAGHYLEKINYEFSGDGASVSAVVQSDITFDDLPSCNLLYISRGEEYDLSNLLDKAGKLIIFTASDIEDFSVKGGVLEMQVTDQKVNLFINEEKASRLNNVSIHPELKKIVQ